MDVATLSMPREEAQKKLREYRRGIHRRADAEWERAAQAYEQLAEGKPVVMLSEVFARCPRDEKLRPRIAIGRADRKQVKYERYGWRLNAERNSEIFDVGFATRGGDRIRDGRILVPHPPHLAALPGFATAAATGYALVPMVPPDVKGTHDLSRHFILWEVEAWADRPLGAVADRDPYLLQKIGDDLFAVVGEWDLTDVERAIMRDRARS